MAAGDKKKGLPKGFKPALAGALVAYLAYRVASQEDEGDQSLTWQQTKGKTYRYTAVVKRTAGGEPPNATLLAGALTALGATAIHIDTDDEAAYVEWTQTPEATRTLSTGTEIRLGAFTLSLQDVRPVKA